MLKSHQKKLFMYINTIVVELLLLLLERERERDVHALLTKAIELALPALPNAPNMGLIITCIRSCFNKKGN